jgi:putative SOS response-associated peptidase YedK
MREAEPLLDLLSRYPSGVMAAYPVSMRVNKPSNDDPGCVEPQLKEHPLPSLGPIW